MRRTLKVGAVVWTCHDTGWWTADVGGVLYERRKGGWYAWPLGGNDQGPYRTMRAAMIACARKAKR